LSKEQALLEQIDKIANLVVEKSLEGQGYVLYSGGVDSSILATLVSKKVKPGLWNLLTLGVSDSFDTRQAAADATSEMSSFLQLPLIVREVSRKRICEALDEVRGIISVESLSHLEDCVAFYVICEEIRGEVGDQETLLLSANGPDELFCGYDRFRRIVDAFGYEEAQDEITRALNVAKILRENIISIAHHFNLRIKEPFFDSEFVKFCMHKIPIELKIRRGNDLVRKRIWRDYAAYLGIAREIAQRPKKAMQYSMGIHKIVFPLIKESQAAVR
jgi:asparagine synthase (glutamine-hydrolysing)